MNNIWNEIENWPKVQIGDICNINPSKKELNGLDKTTPVSFGMMNELSESKPTFTPLGIKKYWDVMSGGYSYFKNEDVLLAKMTPCFENGKSGIAKSLINGIGFGSTEFYVLRCQDTIISDWLYAIISSERFIEKGKYSLIGTTGRRRLIKQFVNNFEIPLPPIQIQNKFANLFRAIDKTIKQAEAQERILIQTKRKLLIDLFNENLKFGTYLKTSDYIKVVFKDIADQISERVEPGETNLEIYVGLGHLDPDNLRIERTGKPTDVKGTKLKVYQGDIIFGKRRAYLRKVAVSHFDGICSAHSMVLRAIEKNIKKKFLPYLMQSDYFMDRAVQISEGSLSPTIKWKVLAKQEFHLPQKEKQDKLILMFQQFDRLILEIHDFQSNLKKLKYKLLDEILG